MRKPLRKVAKLKSVLANPRLAKLGFEQPGPGPDEKKTGTDPW